MRLCPGGFVHNMPGARFHGFFYWGGEKNWDMMSHTAQHLTNLPLKPLSTKVHKALSLKIK